MPEPRRRGAFAELLASAVASLILFALFAVVACSAVSRSPGKGAAASTARLPSTLPLTPVVGVAQSLLGTPYAFGGTDPRGFDCSGFTRYVYQRAGGGLPRSTEEQARVGERVALDEVEQGDLLFFADGSGRLHHVGLVSSGPGEPLLMLHASSSKGVVETAVNESHYWRERLRFARRPSP